MRKAPHVLKKTAAQTKLTVKKKKKWSAASLVAGNLAFQHLSGFWNSAFSPTPTVYPWSGSERPPDSIPEAVSRTVCEQHHQQESRDRPPSVMLPNARPALVVMTTRAMLVQVSYCDWDTCDSNGGGNERISSCPAAPGGGRRSPWCSEQWLEDWEGWGSTGSQVRPSARRPPPPPSPRGFPGLEA